MLKVSAQFHIKKTKILDKMLLFSPLARALPASRWKKLLDKHFFVWYPKNIFHLQIIFCYDHLKTGHI